MQPAVPFDSTVLMETSDSTQKARGAQLLVALMFGVTMFLLCAPVSAALPALGILIAGVTAAIVWWRYLRRAGLRGNNYSPLKTDAEAARTPFNWKEEGLPIVMFVLFFGVANLAPFFDGSARWVFAAIAAVVALGLTYWSLTIDAWLPNNYTQPTELNGDIYIKDSTEWLQAFLYCRRCVPGGLQILSSTLKQELARYGWSGDGVNEALGALVADGNAVKIRELRSKDGAVNWVTLTEEGSRDFQQRYGARKQHPRA